MDLPRGRVEVLLSTQLYCVVRDEDGQIFEGTLSLAVISYGRIFIWRRLEQLDGPTWDHDIRRARGGK